MLLLYSKRRNTESRKLQKKNDLGTNLTDFIVPYTCVFHDKHIKWVQIETSLEHVQVFFFDY